MSKSFKTSVVGSPCCFFSLFAAIVVFTLLRLALASRRRLVAFPALCLAQRHQFDPNSVTASSEQCCDVLWLESCLVEQCYLLSLLHVPGRKDGQNTQD